MVAVATNTLLSALPVKEQSVITQIRNTNARIATEVGKIDFSYPGATAAYGFDGIRSAHGIANMTISFGNIGFVRTLYRSRPDIGGLYVAASLARKKVKLCWMSYAEAAATGHAGGAIPTLIEFSGTGGGRIMLEYARDLVIYTPDHYANYSLVTEHGQPARTM
ncbi:hypothetical protein [Jeongeupia chitinilytica]|uniref:Uncharacterized protein n=1 Tax=Jeongeupia chitinilytica TaxID=1041641 RepID=A0ABQ3GVW7_9NEIS|nr:hypothetical protein [Jeongeupia chitinilytica]GHD56175.1 hypothetical protein GCM10007350_02750 [Jeongeupia chitinilytica]